MDLFARVDWKAEARKSGGREAYGRSPYELTQRLINKRSMLS